MATIAPNSWMPAHGRRKVDIGTSLGRALKARKGTPAVTKRSTLPDRDFYSFRYNFKPPSIDPAKPGTIEVKRGQESTSVTVEHASSQAGESYVFVGREDPAKEMDCVLIYDEQTETFTLEKLDSYMILTYERKGTMGRPLDSPPPPPPAPSTVKEPARDLDFEAQLERDLLVDEDADGESDDEFEEIVPRTVPIQMQKQEEEEEEEEEEIVIPVKPPPPAPPPIKPKRARSVNPPVKTRAPEVPPPGKPKVGRGKGRAKREHVAEEIEEENLEFGQPAQAKRSRPSPPSGRLALPGSSSIVQAPTAYTPSYPSHNKVHLPGSQSIPPLPNIAPSDSDDDWDEVKPTAPVPMVVDEDAEGEDEDIDMNLLAELNQHLDEGSDDDFLAAAVSPEPETVEHVHAGGRPMSLNQFAAGRGEGSQDDDDYSSSEESDDD